VSSLYPYESIRSVDIEGTPVCNADCPMCIRTDTNGNMLGGLRPQQQLTLDEYTQRVFTPQFVEQIQRVQFCGNYGDPCLMWAFRGLVAHLQKKPVHVDVETNGGMHNAAWWGDLGKLSKDLVVTFSIDGLEDTLGIYRRKVNFQKVIENASAFIAAGGKARWAFLVFKHNEHQVDEARRMAKKLGFFDFTLRLTERFYRNDGNYMHPWKARGSHLEAPTAKEYRYERPTTKEAYLEALKTCEVSCAARKESKLYIDYEGNVFPCCFLGASQGDEVDLGNVASNTMLADIKRRGGSTSLRRKSLREIVEGEYFSWVASVLNDPSRRPVACSAVCGTGLFKESKK
jgi:MoaA/NifB/PqqE/SkfB family radical SAM enzyme